MNYYAKAVIECLTQPRTLGEMEDITGLQPRFLLEGIRSARAEGMRITCIPGERGENDEGWLVYEPSTYRLEDRE